MIAPHAIQRHPSNAQPRLRVLHSGCRRACWAMMMRQARRSSAIQHYTVRCGFLSQRSYVAPSRQRRSSSKRPRKELTYCPIYGFKSFLICAKDLTPALFCLPDGGVALSDLLALQAFRITHPERDHQQQDRRRIDQHIERGFVINNDQSDNRGDPDIDKIAQRKVKA